MGEKFGFGWRPDTPDLRDYRETLRTTAATIPVSQDNSKWLGPVRNQGQLGACTAFGTDGMFEFLDNKACRKSVERSELFQYFNTRLAEGTVNSDSGGTIRGAIQAAALEGEAAETDWPYDISKFTEPPPQSAYVNAKLDLAKTYFRVSNDIFPGAWRLAKGGAVVFGAVLYGSFMDAGNNGGWVQMPEPGEAPIGGHCTLAWGYDRTTIHYGIQGWVNVRNSWGKDWGNSGNFQIPIEYLQNAQLASDFWTIYAAGPA